jgi:AraC-like DNA-binding protein
MGMCDRCSRYKDQPQLLNAALHYLLEFVWHRGTSAEQPCSSEDLHPSVLRAVELLRDDPVTGSLDTLARRAGLSKHRLSRLFNQEMGMSITDYRNNLRIQHFLELRKTHDGNLLELALEVGFGSYTQFYRAFQHHMGCSPKDYQDPM